MQPLHDPLRQSLSSRTAPLRPNEASAFRQPEPVLRGRLCWSYRLLRYRQWLNDTDGYWGRSTRRATLESLETRQTRLRSAGRLPVQP
ncbi:hypothetical protein [Ferrimicrobium sp.]|uniref:hypothetical protein n=1 Tax=Ferrimicrobium sp. TaxID=2926050 RepID=UPI00344C346A